MFKYYGNCYIFGAKWLINAVFDDPQNPKKGEGDLTSLRTYYQKLIKLGLLRDNDVDIEDYRKGALETGQEISIEKGELSDKPEGTGFRSFTAKIKIINKSSIKETSIKTDLFTDYFFKILSFKWLG